VVGADRFRESERALEWRPRLGSTVGLGTDHFSGDGLILLELRVVVEVSERGGGAPTLDQVQGSSPRHTPSPSDAKSELALLHENHDLDGPARRHRSPGLNGDEVGRRIGVTNRVNDARAVAFVVLSLEAQQSDPFGNC